MKVSVKILCILMIVFGVGCAKMLETTDKNNVEAQFHYNNFNDADNAILGIYGKLMGLVDRMIVLNELRADLLDITENATFDMAAINNHSATSDNIYCDLAPFYEIILNCNDVIANFDKMLEERKMKLEDYVYRYSDVVTVRCWVYLQMAIHFGRINYITEPLLTVNDLKDAISLAPEIGFDELLLTLRNEMENIPFKDLSIDSPLYGSSTNPDGHNLQMFFLNKKIIAGDLWLWTARDPLDYEKAAAYYYDVIEEGERRVFPGLERYGYKLRSYVWDGSNEPGYEVCYHRFRALDMNSYRNKWKEMFYRASTFAELRTEMITMWYYDSRFQPRYPLVEIFANTGRGKYMLRPSDWSIKQWESQVQRTNNFGFDGRGRQSSFDYVNGQPVVIKYLYDYYPTLTDGNRTIHLQYHDNPYEDFVHGKWFIYRAGTLLLRYAEAANRAGYCRLADAILNDGISSSFNWQRDNGDFRNALTGYDSVRYSGYRPLNDNRGSKPYDYPFFLDARFSDPPAPSIRGPWCDGSGVRGRAFLHWDRPGIRNNQSENYYDEDGVALPKNEVIRRLEEALMREAALEMAFEGHRWGDLLRVAMRKNADPNTPPNEGTIYLNERLRDAGKPANLTTETWFLPRK